MQYYCVTVQRKCSYQNIRVQNNGKRTNLTFLWARLLLVPFIRLQRKRNVKGIFCFFFVYFPFEYTSQFHYNIDRSNIDHYTRHENIIHNGVFRFVFSVFCCWQSWHTPVAKLFDQSNLGMCRFAIFCSGFFLQRVILHNHEETVTPTHTFNL